MGDLFDTIGMIFERSGFKAFLADGGWKTLIMYVIVGVLVYLAIVKKFEPLLLLPIAFGMLLTNIPGANLFHMDLFLGDHIDIQTITTDGGLLDFLYLGVKLGIYPSLIFLGAAAQLGVFIAFVGALLLGFTVPEAASIGIIGGADGPTAILVTKTLAPALLGAIAIAAYSYMALVPFIQPPIMKLCTTKKERAVKMEQLRPVSKTEQILFPVIVSIVICLILPEATSLIGMLMLGNLFRVCGVVERLSKTAQNELNNIIVIFLGVTVGATANAENFLQWQTLYIILLGLCAFAFATLGGVLLGKLMYVITKGKVNPLIGSAGVSAVPMAARVSQVVGQKENPSNFLLMHAMGPNVAGVIGSAVAAGVFLALFQ